uniref:Uncharacterized protein n=1 Tax=Arundo donax TaxID=35708 RepID=A0A0A9AWH3_ARUDO
MLERCECPHSLFRPLKSIFLEQTCQGSSKDAIILDKMPIIAC